MLFGPKKNKEVQNQPVGKPKMEPYDIHVMPQKFHKYLHLKKGMSTGKLLLIFGVVFVVLGGISVGLYLMIKQATPAPEQDLNLNIVQPDLNVNQVNTNTEPGPNVNEIMNFNAIENINLSINENTNENQNANVNFNANTNQSQAPVITYSNNTDTDNDQLTDTEESMYKTEVNLPDTDSDGFIDGQEIINGYNPKAAGASLLENSGFAIKYSNPTFNYEILHPSDWLVKPTDQSLKDVIFQSATGESIEMSVADNPGQLPVAQWYLNSAGESNINLVAKKTLKNGLEALISPDRLTYYIVSPLRTTQVYVIKYNIAGKLRINFYTTYMMMVNSFKFVERPQVAPSNTNEAGNTQPQ